MAPLAAPGPHWRVPGEWRHITDWQAELAPHYDQAKRMLGVTVNPTMTPADAAVRNVARRMGREHTFHLTLYLAERAALIPPST